MPEHSTEARYVVLFKDGHRRNYTAEQLVKLCSGNESWFNFLAMVLGGKPALMRCHYSGGKVEEIKVCRSADIPLDATFFSVP